MASRRINLPRLTLVAGLGGFALMLIYMTLYWDSNPPTLLLPRAPDPNEIDFYAEQASGIRYGADGRWVQTFTAPRVTHYPQTGKTVMTTPALQFRSDKGEIWNGTATEGVLIGDDEIHMLGAVVIHDRLRTTELLTEKLFYFPERQEVTSDVVVDLRNQNNTTRAIGVRADLNRKRIELLHQVEGRHVPE